MYYQDTYLGVHYICHWESYDTRYISQGLAGTINNSIVRVLEEANYFLCFPSFYFFF